MTSLYRSTPPPTASPELRELIEFASEHASRIFLMTGQILPMYHAVRRNGAALIFPAPHNDKDVSVALTRAMFELNDICRYVFIDEAWVLDTHAREISHAEWERIRREGLSQHPDRREVLMISGEDDVSGMVSAHRFILRPEHGKATLTSLEYVDANRSEGRMVGLLPKPKGKLS